MTYQEQVNKDFYDVYTNYIGRGALNTINISLMLDECKNWFGYGHICGVGFSGENTANLITLLKKYGGHGTTCPSFHSYPAECICGWNQVYTELNKEVKGQ